MIEEIKKPRYSVSRKRKPEYFKCLFCNKECVKSKQSFNMYCSLDCFHAKKKAETAIRRKEAFIEGELKHRINIKPFIIERDGPNCKICDQPPIWQGKPMTMILDHIDGDASNDKPENFQLVCPNCDTQLPTYKGRNNGFGRGSRGMNPYS